MLPASISPSNQLIIRTIVDASGRANSPLSSLALGEVLPTIVLEKMAENKYLLALKNLRIPASCDTPLKTNEKLMVRITSLEPQIILNILTDENKKLPAIADKIAQWRANPESLLQMVSKMAELVKLLQIGNLPLALTKDEIQKLIRLFQEIIFSTNNKDNRLFLKEFISKAGLKLENTLRQLVLESAKGIKGRVADDNLKALLLKLSSTLQETLKNESKLDPLMCTKLRKLSSFAEEALKTVETQQVLNSFIQDSDNGLFLQLPLALGESFGLADIIITPEGKGREGRKDFSSSSITIFLDMDKLGGIMINAGLQRKSFTCVIKCSENESREIIFDNLEILKSALSANGYNVAYIDCLQEGGLREQREEFLENRIMPSMDLVNFFV